MEHGHILSAGQHRDDSLNAAGIRARFADHQPGIRSFDTERVRGDHILDPDLKLPPGLRAAAVLVGLVERRNELFVLLTQRHEGLSAHAGQIAFPGGGVEPGDSDAVHAALRETEEEIGLKADRIEVIGRLDTYITGTGFEIVPVVALLRPPFELHPDPREVTEIFEVPLAFILDPANHRRETKQLKNGMRTFFVLPYETRRIWGATAGMLVNLAEVLVPASDAR
jgi:8-oxo-dGTP pyrophosphatase MutT (NUDIX family)